jgi:hypothetical protein
MRFRERHPDMRAFTFYSRSGSASRLNYVFCGGPLLAHFPPVNASIVFQWARRVDHDPVVVDFLFLLPASPVLPPSSSSWKVLSSRLLSPELPSLQLQVAAGVTSRLSDFETLGRECACLVREGSAHSLPSARFEGTDGPFASFPQANHQVEPFQSHLFASFTHLQRLLLECLPPPPVSGSAKIWRVQASWQLCVDELTAIRGYLAGLNLAGRVRPVDPAIRLTLQRRGSFGQRRQIASDISAIPSLMPVYWSKCITIGWFYNSPIGWALSLGFTAEIASRAAPLVSTDKPAPRDTVVVEDLQWPADGVHLSNLADCLALLSGWLAFARASLAASLRIRSTRALASRAALLRSGAIAAWSRKMRPYKPFQPYNPEFVLDSGVPRPPITVADHLLGARQEWVRVLQEPADGWSHPVVGRWVDSHGRGRGVLV